MMIGIDCRSILNPTKGERAGVGAYTYHLVRTIIDRDRRNEYVLFFDDRYDKPDTFVRKNVRVRIFPFAQYKKFLPFSYSHLLIAALIAREKLDVYHAPANVIPYMYTGPSVLTVHDLAIYEKPEWFPRGQKFSTVFLVPRSVKKAKGIIAVSAHTKKRLTTVFSVPSRKITVVHEGVRHESAPKNAAAILKRLRVAKPYILFIGTLEPRKNIPGLVEAFASIHADPRFRGHTLVLAGQKGWKTEPIYKAINAHRLSRRVRTLGYVGHEEKLALLRHAECFVYPSFHEGFGLPALEAMAQGTPVITSSTTSLPEVVGNAALMIDPADPKEITKAMARVLSDAKLAQRMRQAGKQQAMRFPWTATADATINVYERIAHSAHR